MVHLLPPQEKLVLFGAHSHCFEREIHPQALQLLPGTSAIWIFNPSTGGNAITSYTATCGSASASGPSSPIKVSGLANGLTYACTVSATNSYGTGAGSIASSIKGYFVRMLNVGSAGWNLLGNGADVAFDVASAFGSRDAITTVWKWNAAASRWAFYAPSMSASELTDYAASKGYDVLTSIGGGEGFWVNAQKSYGVQVAAGTDVAAADFASAGAKALGQGWSLVALGEAKTPGEFNAALGADLTTLWAWNNGLSKWWFYAPGLAAQGGARSPITSAARVTWTLRQTAKSWMPGRGSG